MLSKIHIFKPYKAVLPKTRHSFPTLAPLFEELKQLFTEGTEKLIDED